MDNEEKNLNDTLTEMVKVELSSNTETKKDELNSTEEIESENNTFDSKIEIKNEELDANVDEVINNIENKEENNVDNIITSNNEDNRNNDNNKNKKSNSLLPIIVLAILIVIGICAYFVYDQYIREDNKEKTNGDITPTPSVAVQVTPTPSVAVQVTPTPVIENNDKINSDIQVEIKDNRFYINGNMVDFYSAVPEDLLATLPNNVLSDYKENIHNEDEFYNKMDNNYDYYIFKDFVYVAIHWPYTDYLYDYDWNGFFIDNSGKIMKTIGNGENDIKPSFNSGNTKLYLEDYNIKWYDTNEVYLIDYDSFYARLGSYSSFYCDALENDNLDDIFYYIDKVSYLGDGKFKVENAVETITFGDLINKIKNHPMVGEDGTIDCSKSGMTTR